jgi:CelD/BcsL family acetyltransferase involved in cellulose biosynthesis
MAVSEASQALVAEVVDAGDAHWREFVLSHAAAWPYHHPAWLESLADAYGYEPRAAVVRSSEGVVLGGIPVVELGGGLRSRRWVSLPFTDSCAPLVDPAFSERELAAALDKLRVDHGIGSFEIRAPVQGAEGHLVPRGVHHRMALEEPEKMLASFKPQVRRNIRKAEAVGLEVRAGERREDLVETYFALHAETRRRLGVPPQPRRFFDSLWRHVLDRGLGFLLLAVHEGVPVGGAVFLEWNERVVYKYGASDHRHWALRPNNLLLWNSMRRGYLSGARLYGFGRTDLEDEGLRSFKRSWGASEEPLEYTSLGKVRHASGRAARLMRPLFRASPLWLNRAAGRCLYRVASRS